MKLNVLASVLGISICSALFTSTAFAQEAAPKAEQAQVTPAKPGFKYGVSSLGDVFDPDAILATYKKITPTPDDPKAKDVFFLDNEADCANLKRDIESVSSDFKGDLGLAIISKDGLVLLKDNSYFPLLNTINFDIVYAAASRMSKLNQNVMQEVKFSRDDLKDGIFSPMYDRLITEGYADLHTDAKAQKDVKEYSVFMVDLMYYALALNDQNACDIILNKYLNGPKDLEQFLKDKDLAYTRVNSLKGEMADDTQKNFGNSAPLFDTALTYVKYMKDSNLNVEFRDLLDQATLETSKVNKNKNKKDQSRFFLDGHDKLQQVSDRMILKAVRSAIENDSDADKKTLRVYLKSSVAEDKENKNLVGINDASFIVYKNEPFIVLASAKNMHYDSPKVAFEQATTAISDSIELAFKYFQNRSKMAARDAN